VGIVAAPFLATSKTIEADEVREHDAEEMRLSGAPALLTAAHGVRIELHHLHRPLRRRKCVSSWLAVGVTAGCW
jgi:hypothetical protein